MKKTTIENTTTKNITAKITATALLFFAIVQFDDKSNVTGKTRLVCGGESLFFGS